MSSHLAGLALFTLLVGALTGYVEFLLALGG
jgi:hypothetical protein